MSDLIYRQDAIDAIRKSTEDFTGFMEMEMYTEEDAIKAIEHLPSAEPEIIRCCKCAFWDRDTLRYQFNDFRNWNEAECKVLAERDGYNEISHYVEADDFCSRAEQRMEVEHDDISG